MSLHITKTYTSLMIKNKGKYHRIQIDSMGTDNNLLKFIINKEHAYPKNTEVHEFIDLCLGFLDEGDKSYYSCENGSAISERVVEKDEVNTKHLQAAILVDEMFDPYLVQPDGIVERQYHIFRNKRSPHDSYWDIYILIDWDTQHTYVSTLASKDDHYENVCYNSKYEKITAKELYTIEVKEPIIDKEESPNYKDLKNILFE